MSDIKGWWFSWNGACNDAENDDANEGVGGMDDVSSTRRFPTGEICLSSEHQSERQTPPNHNKCDTPVQPNISVNEHHHIVQISRRLVHA